MLVSQNKEKKMYKKWSQIKIKRKGADVFAYDFIIT